MEKEEFKSRLLYWHRFFTGKDTLPSANYKVGAFKRGANQLANSRNYWIGNRPRRSGPNSKWCASRPVAYLTTYVEWNGTRFPSTGFQVGTAVIYPDLDVMHSLLEANCVVLNDNNSEFSLTEKGRALIAPFIQVEDQEMEAA